MESDASTAMVAIVYVCFLVSLLAMAWVSRR